MHRVAANGANIPAIGFGTWTLEGAECANLVEHALACGYRHIDTAAMYGNEEAVGAGLRASGLSRDDIFVTTKIWHTDLAEGDLQGSLQASLERLQVEQVDLALIHWPSSNGVPLVSRTERIRQRSSLDGASSNTTSLPLVARMPSTTALNRSDDRRVSPSAPEARSTWRPPFAIASSIAISNTRPAAMR